MKRTKLLAFVLTVIMVLSVLPAAALLRTGGAWGSIGLPEGQA